MMVGIVNIEFSAVHLLDVIIQGYVIFNAQEIVITVYIALQSHLALVGKQQYVNCIIRRTEYN